LEEKAKPEAKTFPLRGLWIAVLLVLVLVGLGTQAFFLKQKHTAEDLQFVTLGPVMPKSLYSGRAMTGDKAGNFFRLNGQGDQWEIHKYSAQGRFLSEYKPTSAEDMLVHAEDMAVDSKGQVYVLQNDGTIKIFDNNLKFLRALTAGELQTLAIDLDSKDQIYVLSRQHSKIVILDSQGQRQSEIGGEESKAGPLAHPFRMVVSKDDWVIVLESLPSATRVQVMSPAGTLKKSFSLEKLRPSPILFLGVDPEGRIYFNDHADQGIYVYEAESGQFIGRCVRTKDQQMIHHPGGVGVNKWTGAVYVDFIPGYIQCRFIESE